jgi:hypothetical protein
MDTGTLISIVAKIDARIEVYTAQLNGYDQKYYDSVDEDQYIRRGYKNNAMRYAGSVYALKVLRDELQNAIEGNIAAMETSMGM